MTADLDPDFIMAMHDLSMSREPGEACFGRLSKAIMPVVIEALRAELQRDTDTASIIHGFVNVQSNVSASLIGTLALPHRKDELRDLYVGALVDGISSVISRGEKYSCRV